MEGAQVEAVRAPAARRLADVQPDPLADLVGDRLTGPAEVAVDLEVEERLVVDHALAQQRAARNACAWSMPMRSPVSSRSPSSAISRPAQSAPPPLWTPSLQASRWRP